MNRSTNDLTGWNRSNETKEKIRQTLTGKKRPKDVVDKVSKKLKGYKWTEDQIKSRSEGLKNFYKHNDKDSRTVWRENISKAHKGKILSETTKEKLSKHNSKLTDSEVLEVVDLINQGKTYKFISEKYGISQSQITSIKQKKTYKWLWN